MNYGTSRKYCRIDKPSLACTMSKQVIARSVVTKQSRFGERDCFASPAMTVFQSIRPIKIDGTFENLHSPAECLKTAIIERIPVRKNHEQAFRQLKRRVSHRPAAFLTESGQLKSVFHKIFHHHIHEHVRFLFCEKLARGMQD